MLDGFPWCNDSLCPRIASLDLSTEEVCVEEVQLDQMYTMAQYETQKQSFMWQLDCLLRDVCGERPRPSPMGSRDPNPSWWQLLPLG